jgi:hypothetical protein
MNTAMTSGATEPVILDAMELASEPDLRARFVESAHQILADLVQGGAALTGCATPDRPIGRTQTWRRSRWMSPPMAVASAGR